MKIFGKANENKAQKMALDDWLRDEGARSANHIRRSLSEKDGDRVHPDFRNDNIVKLAQGQEEVAVPQISNQKGRFWLDGFMHAKNSSSEGPMNIDQLKEHEKPIKSSEAPYGARSSKLNNVVSEEDDRQALLAVQINMPSFSLKNTRLAKIWPSNGVNWRVVAAILGVVAMLIGGWYAQQLASKRPAKVVSDPKTTSAIATELGFVPLAPAGRGKLVPGKNNPYYNSAKSFYEYREDYQGSSLTINEQPLPDKLKKKSEVDKLRQSLTMTDDFTTTLGKAYISTDKTSGAQRVMLLNNYLLMFIQSTKTFTNDQWVSYIESFERID